MKNPQFEGFDINESEKIIHDTGTAAGGTKRDSYSHDTSSGGLAGNQVVQREITNYTPHLPYSPAAGAPEHPTQFVAGHRWTETEGKIHDGVGPGNHPF